MSPVVQRCEVGLQLGTSGDVLQNTISVSSSLSVPAYSALYLGGSAPPPGVIVTPGARALRGFTGCVRHLQVNGAERLVFQDANDGANVGECEVAACSYAPCQNGGICHMYVSLLLLTCLIQR